MQRVRAPGRAAPERYGGHTGGPCSRTTKPTSRGWSRRRPTSRWPNSIPSWRGAVGCGQGSRRSTTRYAGSACGIKEVLENGRAGPARRRPQAPAMAGLAALHGPDAVRLHRRDRHCHRHGAALWPQPLGAGSGRDRAAWPLAHHDLHRRAQTYRHRGAWWCWTGG
jgi:hypothetical protein